MRGWSSCSIRRIVKFGEPLLTLSDKGRRGIPYEGS